MSTPAIAVSGLGKRYWLGEGVGLGRRRRPHSGLVARVLRHRPGEELWALRGVDFRVDVGEAVGIIGGNGAGKSTLFKLLSRITSPTEGEIRLSGRVGSLLEAGTGFNGELTGRENIYLSGVVLGMTRIDVSRHFDEIVAFSGVERFIDTPLKRYSSGMAMRLAFSVAAHLTSDILVIDEVLAVGDAEFQAKCLGKMGEVTKSGRTVLFVSHNMHAIANLCSRAVVLQRGHVRFDGPAQEAVLEYFDSLAAVGHGYEGRANTDSPQITAVRIAPSRSPVLHDCLAPLSVEVAIRCPRPIASSEIELRIVSLEGEPLVRTRTAGVHGRLAADCSATLRCTFPRLRLTPGRYALDVTFAEGRPGEVFDQLRHLCPFEISAHGLGSSAPTSAGGVYLEEVEWEISDPTTADEGTCGDVPC